MSDVVHSGIDPRLLEILVCPLSHDPLRLQGGHLLNERLGIRYPVREGIPILLIDEAELPPGFSSAQELLKAKGVAPRT